MARIERFTSTQPIPVERAQLIDPNAFRFSFESAETLKQIGGVLEELGKRKQAADDSLAVSDMRNSQKLAEADIKQMMLDNPNPDVWAEEIGKILQKQGSQVAQLKSSKEARAKIEQAQAAFREQTVMNGSILETIATINEDVKVTGAGLITAMGSGDEMSIIEARDSHEEALLRKYPPDIAAIELLEILGQGKKAYYINQSKLFPEATIEEAEQKKKALGKGREDEYGLTAKDYSDIVRSAETERDRNIAQTKEELEIRREEDRDVIGEAIHSGVVPEGYASMYDLINRSTLDEDEQHQKLQWAHNEAERKAKGADIIRDDDVYDKLDDRIIDYHLGIETKPAILSDLREARFGDEPTITQKDYEDLKSNLQTEVTKLNAGYLKEARAILRDAIVTDLGFPFGADKDEKLEFRAIAAGLEADIRAGKYEGEAILTQAFTIAERYAEDPIGRVVERMRKFKEQTEETKERLKEVPRRGVSPASKIREWLRRRGAGD